MIMKEKYGLSMILLPYNLKLLEMKQFLPFFIQLFTKLPTLCWWLEAMKDRETGSHTELGVEMYVTLFLSLVTCQLPVMC